MAYKLPDLLYAYDALEPHIDEETMHLHHDKHHQAYVDKLNEALKDYPQYAKYDPEILVKNWKKLPKAIQEPVRNNGGGHVNHSMFWKIMSAESEFAGEIVKQINKDFGTFETFKKKFNEAGTKRFGSGWVWLIYSNDKLHIVTTPNQDNPLTAGDYPILGNDVWEHAYYLKYKNKRDEYLKAWWDVVNWVEVNRRFKLAQEKSKHKPLKTLAQKQYGG